MIINDKMPNYQQSKIYRIVNDSMPGKVYYGSTTQPLSVRMGKHRSLSTKNSIVTSKQLFEIGKPEIVLVENHPCNTKEELLKRERYYIENNNCVNKQIPGRTKEEWYQDNKQKLSAKHKQYYENNKKRNDGS